MKQKLLSQEFRDLCERVGWKFTFQRFAIYKLLKNNFAHPSADMIRAQLLPDYPSISRDSVYRIMCDFAQQGIISKMDDVTQVRFDSNSERHDHFICSKCGKIVDFQIANIEGLLPANIQDFGNYNNIEIRVTGICCDCQKKSEEINK